MVASAMKYDKLLSDRGMGEGSPSLLSICEDQLKQLNPVVDTGEFLNDLGRVIRKCRFDNSYEADTVNNGLKDYGIAEPQFIKCCNRDFESRTKYIDRLIDDQKYLLNPEETSLLTTEINLDLEAYTTTIESKLRFLNVLLEDTVMEIREHEKRSEKQYGHSLKSFYSGEIFQANKDDLNWYFSEATTHEFSELYLNLRKYIDKRKKVQVIRRLTSQYQNIDKPTITDEQNFIVEVDKIVASFKAFNKILFKEMRIDDYLNCFDLNSPSLKHPVFIQGKQADFVYFLSQIPKIRINDKIAEQHFGIKYYKQQISKMSNRMPVFVNQIRAILKIS